MSALNQRPQTEKENSRCCSLLLTPEPCCPKVDFVGIGGAAAAAAAAQKGELLLLLKGGAVVVVFESEASVPQLLLLPPQRRKAERRLILVNNKSAQEEKECFAGEKIAGYIRKCKVFFTGKRVLCNTRAGKKVFR